jgi:hypothetical protein
VKFAGSKLARSRAATNNVADSISQLSLHNKHRRQRKDNMPKAARKRKTVDRTIPEAGSATKSFFARHVNTCYKNG